MGKTAREVMTGGAECIGENDTLLDAAKRLAELDVGAMPICVGNEERGILGSKRIEADEQRLNRGKWPQRGAGFAKNESLVLRILWIFAANGFWRFVPAASARGMHKRGSYPCPSLFIGD